MKFSQSQKEKMVIRYRNGESVKSICESAAISRGTVYNWIKSYDLANQKGLSSMSCSELNNKLNRNIQLIEVLQKVNCTVNSPLNEKLNELEKLKEEYPVRILCEALKVDRGTFYNHILRNKKENNSYNKRFSEMCTVVEKIFMDSNRVYGVKKITAILKKRGVPISEEYVRRIMREKELISIRNTSKADYRALYKAKKDSLNYNFTTTKPNEVWVSDTSQLQVKNTNYYICAILDLFSRKIISYKVNTRHTTNLISATFDIAYQSRNPTNLIFHSDRGTQYSSKSFMLKLKNYGITQSFSPVGSPTRNAVKESFFNNFKREEFYRLNYRSYNELKNSIKNYIEKYNNDRPHSYNKYKTPNEVEDIYFDNLTK